MLCHSMVQCEMSRVEVREKGIQLSQSNFLNLFIMAEFYGLITSPQLLFHSPTT